MDDPLLTDTWIFLLIGKTLGTYLPTEEWTNGWMDRQMDGWTDRPSYRDARMHLKTIEHSGFHHWKEKCQKYIGVNFI